MARCIDADKAIEVIVNTPSMVGSRYDFDHNVLTALVDREHEITDLINNNVPTSDVAPVIHAHWIEEEDCTAVTDIPWSMCSACGSYSLKLPYCAFCGAKMDEEQ